jgi:hypothetical protein
MPARSPEILVRIAYPQRAFRGIDLEKLDAEFKEWVRELELPEDAGPIQVRRR